MTTVNDLLRDKSPDLWTVSPDDSVFDALRLMADQNIGVVLALESGRLAGLLSERDCVRKLALENRIPHDTPIRDVMTEHVICVSPTHKIDDCLSLMSDKHFRHLPVMDGDKLVGLLSIGDLVKAIISDKASMIEHLEQYITGQ